MRFNRLRRREFITLLGGSAVAWPLAARPQEAGRIYRLGTLNLSPRSAPNHVAFYAELQRLGFNAGQNLVVDERGYGLHVEQLADHAAEIVKAQVDVINATGDLAIRAAQQATKTIPILAFTDDMVGSKFVSSLAKPGGNTTGVSIFGTELDGKRQEILIEAVPGLRRMAALADSNTNTPRQLQALQDAARARGVELSIYEVAKPNEIAAAIDAAKKADAAALNVLASPLFFADRQVIMERATALHLPAMYHWPEVAEQGGLLGYGPRLVLIYREILARQMVALLRGTKPGDIPVEQPTKFELVINLKTAKALGLPIPPLLLTRADEVIE
jgi:putative tryptophan/tyrosine transport system substrate-binding protein